MTIPKAKKGTAPRCPICGRPQVRAFRPFCSKRCSDLDLGRWLGDAYRVPGPPAEISEATDDDDEA